MGEPLLWPDDVAAALAEADSAADSVAEADAEAEAEADSLVVLKPPGYVHYVCTEVEEEHSDSEGRGGRESEPEPASEPEQVREPEPVREPPARSGVARLRRGCVAKTMSRIRETLDWE